VRRLLGLFETGGEVSGRTASWDRWNCGLDGSADPRRLWSCTPNSW